MSEFTCNLTNDETLSPIYELKYIFFGLSTGVTTLCNVVNRLNHR